MHIKSLCLCCYIISYHCYMMFYFHICLNFIFTIRLTIRSITQLDFHIFEIYYHIHAICICIDVCCSIYMCVCINIPHIYMEETHTQAYNTCVFSRLRAWIFIYGGDNYAHISVSTHICYTFVWVREAQNTYIHMHEVEVRRPVCRVGSPFQLYVVSMR